MNKSEKEIINKLVDKMVISGAWLKLAHGYLRYEAVRRMNPCQFGEICKRNLRGERFDDMVDEAILEEANEESGE